MSCGRLGQFVFMRKLKFLKERLNDWNREVCGNISVRNSEIIHEIGKVEWLEVGREEI